MKRILALGLALLLALTGCGGAASSVASAESAQTGGTELEVYFFDAGKADAILLTTENSTVLLDAGEKGFGQTILSELEERGITAIDYLIISHFDQDHVGGAAKVLNSISVGTVLESDCPKDSEEYEKYLKALANAGIDPETVTETYTFTLDGVTYSVDPPRKNDYNEDDSNNSSLILSVTNGDTALLFTGDAQTERLEEFLESNTRTYDFLKVPHHGGEEPLMSQLIESAGPRYAVITCSQEEPEAESTALALESAGVETYLTRLGAVVLRSDGTDLTIAYAE